MHRECAPTSILWLSGSISQRKRDLWCARHYIRQMKRHTEGLEPSSRHKPIAKVARNIRSERDRNNLWIGRMPKSNHFVAKSKINLVRFLSSSSLSTVPGHVLSIYALPTEWYVAITCYHRSEPATTISSKLGAKKHDDKHLTPLYNRCSP